MDSAEDYEFTAQTSAGSRRAVVSKWALHILAGRSGISPTEVARMYRAELDAIVEAKLASGRTISDPIRLHGTDL